MPPITSRIAVIAVETLQAVALSLLHNWLALSLAIVIAAAMKVHADPRRLERAMAKRTHAAILGSVLLGALTPLCACGTMAVILGMLSATVPWAPIMAFLTSSPLMSPDGFVLLTGIIGLDFAVAVAVASVVIGVGSGYVTHLVERRTGFLKNQTRFATKGEGGACDGAFPATATAASAAACACAAAAPATSAAASSRAVTTAVPLTACCAAAAAVSSPATALAASASALLAQVTRVVAGLRVPDVVRALQDVGARQILLSFAIFVAVGHLINRLVPVELIGRLFGSGHAYSVPFAALVGLPFYVTTESSVPIIQALMKSGASPGAMLSFMITGPATSAWVIAGLSTFLRPRAILFYVGLVLAGGILSGYGYEAFLALR